MRNGSDDYTTQEFAALHGVSVETVRYWIRQGYLQSKKPSPRLILISKKAAEQFVRPGRGRYPFHGRRRKKRS